MQISVSADKTQISVLCSLHSMQSVLLLSVLHIVVCLVPPSMVCGDLLGFCPHNQGHAAHSLDVSTRRADSVSRGGFQPRKGSELWGGDEVVFFPFPFPPLSPPPPFFPLPVDMKVSFCQ
jgi:hypothetical protein